MACPPIQLFKNKTQSHASICSFLLCSYSLYQQALSVPSQCTIMSTSFQFHCNYPMKAAITSCLDYANYLLIDLSAVTMTPHVPWAAFHCSQNDSIKNVYQAPIHLKQASGNDGLLAKSVLPLVFIWTLRVWSLGQEDLLEEGMATCSSILTWEIPWTEEPGGLQPMGSQRVRHDGSDLTHTSQE